MAVGSTAFLSPGGIRVTAVLCKQHPSLLGPWGAGVLGRARGWDLRAARRCL